MTPPAEASRFVQAWRTSRLRAMLRGTGQRLSTALQTSRWDWGFQTAGTGAVGRSRVLAALRSVTGRLDQESGLSPSGRGGRLAAGLALLGFALAGLLPALVVGAPWGVFLALVSLAVAGGVLSFSASRGDAIEGSWMLSGSLAEASVSEELTRPAEGSGEDERSSG